MPELLRCIECDTPITFHDHQCPHCYTEYPLGVICLGCFETLKQSAAVQHETHTTNSIKYFHPACYQKIMQPLSTSVHAVNEGFNNGNLGNSYDDEKKLNQLIREEEKRARRQYSRNRVERFFKKFRRTLKFIIIAVFGFVFWGAILSYIFGEIGFFIAFIVTMIMTVQFMNDL